MAVLISSKININVGMDECNLNCYGCPTDGKCQPLIGTYTCLCNSTNYAESQTKNCEIPEPPSPTEPTKPPESSLPILLLLLLIVLAVICGCFLIIIVILSWMYIRQNRLMHRFWQRYGKLSLHFY